jgi:PPP family 3-phenylpropionic acid transporter
VRFYVFYSIHLDDHGYSKFLVGCLWSLGVVAEIVVFFLMARLLRALLACAPSCWPVLPQRSLRFLMIGWGVEWQP